VSVPASAFLATSYLLSRYPQKLAVQNNKYRFPTTKKKTDRAAFELGIEGKRWPLKLSESLTLQNYHWLHARTACKDFARAEQAS